ncbi:hypothetical protein HMPREF0063_11977 [Aeromicrobium marinum DSM 15272]|uniref:DinB family protein n=1 Tax=Aeromicrobium marinum DSM 15272 TaxID=585531 RepID=E2SE41_9ACTN|nr:DinB family protein [Aeromicrobium marinum]EFQ82768.1 hypothetical protein HMPREF0063_11977 [Aeromicrobium marinum DSM 15272]
MSDVRTAPDPEEPRIGPPRLAGDRDSLESWLDFYRASVPLKVAGLTPEQLCTRSVPPSGLTLAGIVRHLTFVEQFWCGTVVAGLELPPLYRETDRDGDFAGARPETALADLERYLAELPVSRERVRGVTDLDAPLPGRHHGQTVNLRWVLVHLVEEYARHLGHADLLREAVDGVTGY